MYIVRAAAIIFALMNSVGLIWFIDTTRGSISFFGMVTIVCALAVSMTPRRLINNAAIRWTLITLCIVGVGSLFALITKDYQRAYGPDFGAIIMRLLFASTFVFMGLEAYRKKVISK